MWGKQKSDRGEVGLLPKTIVIRFLIQIHIVECVMKVVCFFVY